MICLNINAITIFEKHWPAVSFSAFKGFAWGALISVVGQFGWCFWKDPTKLLRLDRVDIKGKIINIPLVVGVGLIFAGIWGVSEYSKRCSHNNNARKSLLEGYDI